MKAKINVGNTWHPTQIEKVIALNTEFGNDAEVDCMYGSTGCNILGNARSPDRIQNLAISETSEYIETAHASGLQIAWTINESCVGNTVEYVRNFRSLAASIREFFDILNPDILVVAHTLTMLMLQEIGEKRPIEISTITDLREPNQLVLLVEKGINIKRICLPISQNRNLTYLRSFQRVASTLSIELEVLVNEFCFLDRCNCAGLFRRSCYDMNAHAKDTDCDADENFYPRAICTHLREKDPVNWLRAKWILPQDMAKYQEIGINRFKLSGRTHPVEYLLSILPHYLARSFSGNLLELWPHLQTIGKLENFEEEQKHVLEQIHIAAGPLSKAFSTSLLLCPNDCNRCQICGDIYSKLLQEGHIR